MRSECTSHPSTSQEKRCTICGEIKPLSEFHRMTRSKDGHRSQCKPCHRAASAQFRQEHPDYAREYRRIYRPANAEKIRKQQYAWVERNRDHLRSYQSQRRQVRHDHLTAYRREWHRIHPESKQTYENNRRNAEGRFTRQEWVSLKARFGNRCLACNRSEPEVKISVDHVVPLSLGGGNTIDNLQPLCRSCNSVKGARIIDYRSCREVLP